jgi:hypothetical protein
MGSKQPCRMKIYTLGSWQYWYDRAYRSWYAATFDPVGNQIGPAIFAYTKQEIINLIKSNPQ